MRLSKVMESACRYCSHERRRPPGRDRDRHNFSSSRWPSENAARPFDSRFDPGRRPRCCGAPPGLTSVTRRACSKSVTLFFQVSTCALARNSSPERATREMTMIGCFHPGRLATIRFDPPGQGNEQAHQGDIRVPIRHGLGSHLDDPDDRNQRAQVPQPADEQEGKLPCLSDSQTGDRNQDQNGNTDLPGRRHSGVRIETARSTGQSIFQMYSM